MIHKLQSPWILLLCIALALTAQIPHAMYVFAYAPYASADATISNWEWLFALAYASAVEGATFIFVAHRRRTAANGFACASFAINLCYYAMHGVNLFALSAIPRWILSGILPLAIAGYSHLGEALEGKDDGEQWALIPAWLDLSALAFWRNDDQNVVDAPSLTQIAEPVQTGNIEPEAPTEGQETTEEVFGVDFASLPREQQKAWALRLIEDPDRTMADVAALFGVSASTISRWVSSMKESEVTA